MSKLFPIFLAILLCASSAAPQSRKRQQKSGLPKQVAVKQQVTEEEKQGVVEQLVSDGKLTMDCIKEEGGPMQIIGVDLIDLNGDGKRELQVYGQRGCACGARRCYQWIYRKRNNGYELLLSAGAADEIHLLRTSTNGYLDLEVVDVSGNDFYLTTYKFDGSRYQRKECKMMEYLGGPQVKPLFRTKNISCN